MKEREEWFKIKKYPYIGLPITIKDYDKVRFYVNNPYRISRHSFLPFIHKTIADRRFRPNKNSKNRNPKGKRKRFKDIKVRDIYFASHLDAMIYSKYNEILLNKYEAYIKHKPFNSSVVAYRSIPIVKGEKAGKCNIDFAKEAFEFIQKNQEDNLSVIVADITSFFDNLNHKNLKSQWAKVLNKRSLPKDHYNLFKALTRIKYVESNQLFEAYDKKMIVSRGVPNNDKRKEYVRRKISSQKYFKEKSAVAYCEKKEFLNNNLNLIISKNNEKGIPQGSPISATLANIYMLDFDKNIFELTNLINGFYQRYSDDIIIICNSKYENKVLKFMREAIRSEKIDLQIQRDKTNLFHFKKSNIKWTCVQVDEVTKQKTSNKNLEYLGFTFDGEKVLIKSSGFSKFYRNMRNAMNRATGFALSKKNRDNTIHKSKLYKRFTYKGAKRKNIYRPSPENPKKYIRTREYNWGNYLSYVYKANEAMKSINKDDSIKRQTRKTWGNFHSLLKIQQNKIDRAQKQKK